MRWNKKIEDGNQPLLIATHNDERIFIVPSLCHRASLPDDFTSDTKNMRKL